MVTANLQEIQRTVSLLWQAGDTIELRCLGDRVINGFYRDFSKLAEHACALSEQLSPQKSVYASLNPIDPLLYGRRAENYGPAHKGGAVGDADVLYRRWLLIDIDATRPSGVSATDEQKQAAEELARGVYQFLEQIVGTSTIVFADSGNGFHLLLRLPNVPNDAAAKWHCEQLLRLLADQFNTAEAKVDRQTANAGRLVPIYGTVKRKGSDVAEQPHRLSRLLHVPDPVQPANWSAIVALTGPFRSNGQPVQVAAAPSDRLDIDKLLQDRGILYTRDDTYQTNTGETATRWVLDACPWNPAHDDRTAFIIRFPSGSIAAGCLHDSCAQNDYQTLKRLWNLPTSVGVEASDIVLPPQSGVASRQAVLAITPASSIQPRPVEWLWPGKFPLGKLSILAGNGGNGKTFIALDLTARTSAGQCAPDGQPLRSGGVLFATGEDGLADTIVPRLIAHGADLRKVDFIEGIRVGTDLHLLDLLRHVEILREGLKSHPDTVLLVVDPISSFMGDIDTHKASDVRRVLSAVAKLAEDFGVAFIGIHHLRKQQGPAIHSITGSQAFSDAVRTVWMVVPDREHPGRRLMLPAKNNLVKTYGSGLAYTIDEGRVVWEPTPVLVDVDDVLFPDDDASPRAEAKDWLKSHLRARPQPAAELLRAA